jgi:4-hydroxy-tetrahydrodipicolinate reductase
MPANIATPTSLRIGIAGVWGRMGQTLLGEILHSEGAFLFVAGSEAPGHERFGDPLLDPLNREPLGLSALGEAAALFEVSDVVLDFTTPQAAPQHAAAAAANRTALIVGTTGLRSSDHKALEKAARRAPVLIADNMSLGVNLLVEATRLMAAQLDEDFDIEIQETHHRDKRDAPSGTALALGRAAAAGRGGDLGELGLLGAGDRGGQRRRGKIGFAVTRGGDVAGEHTVLFAGPGERIELTHRAGDRRIFARGALRAATWLYPQPPGLYGMPQMLGLGDG